VTLDWLAREHAATIALIVLAVHMSGALIAVVGRSSPWSGCSSPS
jgi:hypothetical protein